MKGEPEPDEAPVAFHPGLQAQRGLRSAAGSGHYVERLEGARPANASRLVPASQETGEMLRLGHPPTATASSPSPTLDDCPDHNTRKRSARSARSSDRESCKGAFLVGQVFQVRFERSDLRILREAVATFMLVVPRR